MWKDVLKIETWSFFRDLELSHFFLLVNVNTHISVLHVKAHILPKPLKRFYLEKVKITQKTVHISIWSRFTVSLGLIDGGTTTRRGSTEVFFRFPTLRRMFSGSTSSKRTSDLIPLVSILLSEPFLWSSDAAINKGSHLKGFRCKRLHRSYLLSSNGIFLWGAAALGFRLW